MPPDRDRTSDSDMREPPLPSHAVLCLYVYRNTFGSAASCIVVLELHNSTLASRSQAFAHGPA